MENTLNVLLLGSGGREHALAWKIAQSPLLGALYIAPGNPGTASLGKNVALNPLSFSEIGKFVLENHIHMVVVGPEEPLVKGISDYFQAEPALQHVIVIGPTAAGAALEGSKDFAKQFMNRYGIPTARYQTFNRNTLDEGKAFLHTLNPPFVLKADGLAAGKGVLITESYQDACAILEDMLLNQRFGNASEQVIVEEFLKGIELSVFAITDGDSYLILPEAKDYKRVGDNDSGPNTGGMGSVSPVPFADKEFMKKVEEQIVKRTIEGLKKENILYKGFLFFGLMNVAGDPYVIEYNVRMGDPETEVVVPRIQSDLLELLVGVHHCNLKNLSVITDFRSAVCVMMVSGGYPDHYEKGKQISGVEGTMDSLVFHAGTRFIPETGKLVTSGGRVLAVCSFGKSLSDALETTYRSIDQIHFEGARFRHDIGKDVM